MFDIDELYHLVMINLDLKSFRRFSCTCKLYYSKDNIQIIRELIERLTGFDTSTLNYDTLKRIYCLTYKTICSNGVTEKDNKIVGTNNNKLELVGGRVFVTGTNYYGQLGVINSRPKNEMIETLDNILDISTSNMLSAALSNDGKVYVFGTQYVERYIPTIVDGLDDVKQISVDTYLYALKNNGTVYVYGYDIDVPIIIDGLQDIVQITSGLNMILSLNKYGKIYTYNFPKRELATLDLDNIISVTIHSGCFFAIDIQGNVYGWGYLPSKNRLMVNTPNPRLLFTSNNVNEVGIYKDKITTKINHTLTQFMSF
jgi:alpha-tubulin suppressor-like RCC1 family protein